MTKKPKKPSLITMVKNFAKDSAQFIKQGAPMCSTEEFEERMTICKSCENLTEEDKCGLCGCFMPVKAGWKTTECADNPKRWHALVGPDAKSPTIDLVDSQSKDINPDDVLTISGQSAVSLAKIQRENINKLKTKSGKK